MGAPGTPGRRRAGYGPRHGTGRRRRRPRWPWGLVVLGAVVAGWAGWLLVDASTARAELSAAATSVAFLRADVLAGDAAAATESLAALRTHAAAAREATQGPHWSLGARLPWVGPNVEAVRTVADVVHVIADGPAATLLDATVLVDPGALAPSDGLVDVAQLEAAAPRVVAAYAAVRDAVDRLAAVDRDELWPVVDDAFGHALGEVADLQTSTATAARAVQLVPPMLGADGPRDYLVLVQGPAEARATGGAVDAVLLLRAEAGAVTLVDHRPGGALAGDPDPVVQLTADEEALVGGDLAAGVREVGRTPDFPRGAAIARETWRRYVDQEVDGVVAVDPATLGLILRATGPVPISGPVGQAAGGELTAENAVDVLVGTAHATLPDPAARDTFLAASAGSVLGALLGGGADPAGLVDALAEAARRGHLLVWSAHPAEQELLAGTVMSGELRGHVGDSPLVGVFVNDGGATSLDHFLTVEVTGEEAVCLPDGGRDVSLAVTLTHTLAPDDVAALPAHQSAAGGDDPPGGIRADVLLYAPTGGSVRDVVVGGEDPGGVAGRHDGLDAVGRTVRLAPGESVVVGVTVRVGPELPGALRVRTSPWARSDVAPVATGCSPSP